MMYVIHVGVTAVVPISFDPSVFSDVIEKYEVTTIFAAPSMINFFAKSSIVPRYDYSSLKEIFSASARGQFAQT